MGEVDIGDIAIEIAKAGKAEILSRLALPIALAQRGDARGVLPRGIVGDPRRISTATSRMDPRVTRSSFAWACGGAWKCSPRITPFLAEKE